MKNSTRYSTVFLFFIFFIIFAFIFYKTFFFYCSGIYETDILPKDNFEKILEICSNYNEKNMVNDPKANSRLMHIFPVQDPIYDVLFQPIFIRKIRSLCGNSRLSFSTPKQ